jgi:outer membrane usher protein
LRPIRRASWRSWALLLALVPGLLAEEALVRLSAASPPPSAAVSEPPPVAAPVPAPLERQPQRKHHHRRHHRHLHAHTQASPRQPAPRDALRRKPAATPAPVALALKAAGPQHPADGTPEDAAHPPPAAADKTPPAPSAATPVWLEVEINGQHPGTALLLRDPQGRTWVSREDLERWRLRVPPGRPLLDGGIAYYPLDAFPGLACTIDDAAQSIAIRAPAELFVETIIGAAHTQPATPVHSAPGGFFNYDVVVARATGDGSPDRTTANGLFEAGAFGRWGTGTNTFVRSESATAGVSSLVRLDTTLTQDQPEALASLRVGDSISGASSWGGAVHFGGVQWSTDFTTQPGFVTTPLAGLHGEAILPSTLDLYINNALNLETNVLPGPFTIDNLPLVSGQGTARLVVRDILGQEQQINVPYYASPVLLRPGLSSFSYEVGAVRDDYALQSNDYGRSLAIGTQRYGFSDTFTGELRAEVLRDQQTAGLGGAWLVDGFAVANAAVSASHSARGDGELLQLGFSRQSRAISFGANATLESPDYIQVGMLPTQLAPVRVLQGFVAMPMVGRGSLSLNYVQDDYRDQSPAHLLSSQVSWPVGQNGFFGMYALKPLRGGAGPVLGVNFIYTLGARNSVSASVTRQNSGTQDEVQMQQSLPAGRGLGYRVAVGTGAGSQWDAMVDYQNDVGTYTLRSVRDQSQSTDSAEVQGGVALLDGEAFLTRKMDESFAVVRVGDYPNVHVYADNQEVGITDSSGTALVPRIRAYDHNPLRIEQADLPLDVDIDTLEKDAVPYRFSGVLVNFDVKRSLGALVTLTQDDGRPVPAGASAKIAGSDIEFPVGMHGEVYLAGLSNSSAVRVSWAGSACDVTVAFVQSADPVPRLGPYVCKQVSP